MLRETCPAVLNEIISDTQQSNGSFDIGRFINIERDADLRINAMWFCLTSRHKFIANFTRQNDIYLPIPVNVTDLSLIDHPLQPAEAIRSRNFIRPLCDD